MKIISKAILATLGFLTLLGATGCFNAHEAESTLPWSRPASWEKNQIGVKY